MLEREIRKILTFVIHEIASKTFEKIILRPLDPLGSPNRYREQMQILMHRLECISRDLKVLWIASKVFLMYLGGNRRWLPLNTGLTVVRSAARVVTFMFKFHDQV